MRNKHDNTFVICRKLAKLAIHSGFHMNQTGVFILCVRYGSAGSFGRSDRLELSSLRLELWIFLIGNLVPITYHIYIIPFI